MKVHLKYGKFTQIMHGAGRNNRYVWDVSSVRPTGKLLAGDAVPHDVFRISHGARPVEPCSKSLGHERVTARVMPTGAFVNLEQ